MPTARGLFRHAVVATTSATILLASVGCPARDSGRSSSSAGGRPDLALSPTGDALGPLTTETPFDVSELRSLFPSATVTEGMEMTEGEPYPVFRVETEGVRLLVRGVADSSSIHSVEILGGSSVAGLGAELGGTFAETFPPGSVAECGPGSEEASGLVVCGAPANDHLTLVFGGRWDGPDGELPPPETLRGWTVERLLWKP